MAQTQSEFIVPAPLDVVWAFHDDPTGLTKITPFPIKVVLRHVDRPARPGSAIHMTFWFGFVPVKWNVVVQERVPLQFFRDEQPKGQGPFAHWSHTHAFEAIDDHTTKVIDRIDYTLPGGALGRIVDAVFMRFAMRGMFAARSKATRAYFAQTLK